MLSILIRVYVVSCICTCTGMKCDEYILKNFLNSIEAVSMLKILSSTLTYFMLSVYKKNSFVIFRDYFNYRA